MKRLTGSDRIKARRMREDFWSFSPSHTFVMLTNHKPLVTGRDEGIWRRLRLVPFEVTIPEDKRDEHLGEKLAREADAVLAWLVAGHRDWADHGLAEPDAVVKATSDYRDESDLIEQFLDACCFRGPYHSAGSSELYASWCRWCDREGAEPGTHKAFTTALQNKGFDNHKDGLGRKRWYGIGLTAGEDRTESHEGSNGS